MSGLFLGLIGTLVLTAGLVLLLAPLSTILERLVEPIPYASLLAPNLVLSGVALIEGGRHVATAGGDRESRFYGRRLNILTGRVPTDSIPEMTTAAARWHIFLLGATTVQVAWAVLRFGIGMETTGIALLRYGSAVAMSIAGHYSIAHVAVRAGWSNRRLWDLSFLVFPLNLLAVVLYTRVRRAKLHGITRVSTNAEDSTSETDTHSQLRPSIWQSLIGIALIIWVSVLLIRFSPLSGGRLVSFILVLAWVILPVAIYRDISTCAEQPWESKRVVWLLGAIFPALNVVVGFAYLFRRHETKRASHL